MDAGAPADGRAHSLQKIVPTEESQGGDAPLGPLVGRTAAALASGQADSAALAFILIFASLFSTKWGLF